MRLNATAPFLDSTIFLFRELSRPPRLSRRVVFTCGQTDDSGDSTVFAPMAKQLPFPSDPHVVEETSIMRDLVSLELSHRIRNIFAVVSGLVALSAWGRPEMQPFARLLQARIDALAAAHACVSPQGPARAVRGLRNRPGPPEGVDRSVQRRARRDVRHRRRGRADRLAGRQGAGARRPGARDQCGEIRRAFGGDGDDHGFVQGGRRALYASVERERGSPTFRLAGRRRVWHSLLRLPCGLRADRRPEGMAAERTPGFDLGASRGARRLSGARTMDLGLARIP